MRIKHANGIRRRPINPARPISRANWKRRRSAELGKRRINLNYILGQLARVFAVYEEEQFVFDNRATSAESLLRAARFGLFDFVETAGADLLITPKVKTTTVKLVAS